MWGIDVTDKVFGPASLTETVYEEGVKNVALSALMGINGSEHLYIICLFLFNSLFNYNLFNSLFNYKHISMLNLLLSLIFTATIFAYGQTSSGKTYTMRGITEKAVNDIYKHIINVSFI